MGAGKIPPTYYAVCPGDANLDKYCKERHDECILPPVNNSTFRFNPANNSIILGKLAAGILRQNEESKKTRELRHAELDARIEEKETKKDKVENLHSTVFAMLKNAVATVCDETPETIPDSCSAFFNSDSAGLADQELMFQFETLGMNDIHFIQSFQALYMGNFLYPNKGAPCNFSCFCFSKRDLVLTKGRTSRALLIHLLKTEGNGKTLDERKVSAKQTIKAPCDFNVLVQYIMYFCCACAIFFGKLSIGSKATHSLFHDILANKHDLKDMISGEKSFATKFLYTIDIRF